MKLSAYEITSLQSIQKKVHAQSETMGWYDKHRDDGTFIALIHSEISEALEGIRKNSMDDHLPLRQMAEVELADAVIRILDFAEYKGYDIASALSEKHIYNRNRADHQLKNRNLPDGKIF